MKKKLNIEDIKVKSSKMRHIYRMIPEIALTDAPILIQGEDGTEKELIARVIHLNSARRNKPFTVFNCSAYPQHLLESELFGHEAEAFKGALNRHIGCLERSHGGTVFLDEVEKIPPISQAKLLRFLQTKEFERLGSSEVIQGINVRIIAATNSDLKQEVEKGTFSEDLYYELNTINIYLPPLRQRKEDIQPLTEYFLEKLNLERGKKIKRISSSAMQILVEYTWPGNVKELENTIQHAFISAKGETIEERDLPTRLLNEVAHRNEEEMTSFEAHERRLLIKVLQKHNWNKQKVAKELGISRSTLYAKLKKYNISTKPGV